MSNFSVNNYSFVNKSFAAAKSNSAQSNAKTSSIQAALSAIQGLGLKVEICGSWLWIFGADSSHETQLRKANFKWSYQRGCWYLCPPIKDANAIDNIRSNCQPWGMNKVRKVFGSKVVQL